MFPAPLGNPRSSSPLGHSSFHFLRASTTIGARGVTALDLGGLILFQPPARYCWRCTDGGWSENGCPDVSEKYPYSNESNAPPRLRLFKLFRRSRPPEAVDTATTKHDEWKIASVRAAISEDWIRLAERNLTTDQRRAVREHLDMNIAKLRDLVGRDPSDSFGLGMSALGSKRDIGSTWRCRFYFDLVFLNIWDYQLGFGHCTPHEVMNAFISLLRIEFAHFFPPGARQTRISIAHAALTAG